MIDLAIDQKRVVLSSLTDPDLRPNGYFKIDLTRDFYTINLFRNCIKNSEYKLVVPYTGNILVNLHGFYRSSYVENGTTFKYVYINLI